MDINERIKMIRAMDMIARSVNNENAFMYWLENGVPDGDITEDTTDEELKYLCDDDIMKYIMHSFVKLMGYANKDGLYFDGIVG